MEGAKLVGEVTPSRTKIAVAVRSTWLRKYNQTGRQNKQRDGFSSEAQGHTHLWIVRLLSRAAIAR